MYDSAHDRWQGQLLNTRQQEHQTTNEQNMKRKPGNV
jgi:hypothetical protein